jgi:uncharacterized protein YndB with AHSA1/START domain
MKSTIDNHAPGEFARPGEVRLVRLLPGPIERVWQYLTDPEKRARWLAGGTTEQKVGGKVVFVMHHKNIAPHETPPDKWKHVHETGVTFEGRVLRCEPPHLLAYTFGGDDSVVTFELQPLGSQVRLVVTHRATGEDLPEITNYASGWHTHLSLLIALLEDKPLPSFWAGHATQLAEYQCRYEARFR